MPVIFLTTSSEVTWVRGGSFGWKTNLSDEADIVDATEDAEIVDATGVFAGGAFERNPSTSSFVMLPDFPDPLILERSIFWSLANFLTVGEAKILPSGLEEA